MPAPTAWLLSLASMTAIGMSGLVEEDVVGLLGFAALDRLAANDDPALGEIDLLANLGHHVPLAAVDRRERGDELGADIRFGEVFLVHSPTSIRTLGCLEYLNENLSGIKSCRSLLLKHNIGGQVSYLFCLPSFSSNDMNKYLCILKRDFSPQPDKKILPSQRRKRQENSV